MKHINKQTNQPYKIVVFGDLVTPSGFGRINNEVAKRLVQRGYALQGASISYNGWPHTLPFHVWPLAGQDIWNGLVGIVNAIQPDLLISCQDFPYHQTIWNACRIDFSRVKWMWITPIDGVPVHPEWVKLCDFADGKMVISRFGVEALRQEGKRVELCHPGVDTGEFYPAEPDEKKHFRDLAGFGADDWIVGVMCMNQGRKAISAMIEGFYEFARDKPDARLYLDMDNSSPAGWDIPSLLKQMRWTEEEQKRVKYREDVWKSAQEKSDNNPNHEMLSLRNRYSMLDLHMVIAHREGFGLPHLEAMACRIPTMAMDWCSGTEICGEGRGILVKRLPYMEYGCWGGSKDAFPDMAHFAAQLNDAYRWPEGAHVVATRGYEWAIQQTWDKTTDQVEAVIQQALKRERKERPVSHEPTNAVNANLSDTRGPSHQPNPLGDSPVVQPTREPAPVPAVPGADGH